MGRRWGVADSNQRNSAWKVDVTLPGKRNSDSHGTRPVHLIISVIKWIRSSRSSIKRSLSVKEVVD